MKPDEPRLPGIANDEALLDAMRADPEVEELREKLLRFLVKYRHAYNWTWFDRPIIQLPSDIMAMQTLILHCQPDLIIETGVAHGGSLVFYASMLELLGKGQVVGVDNALRIHNRRAIEAHPLTKRISVIDGSSTDAKTIEQVAVFARDAERVFVCLDSNHTADHVARELELYAPFVTPGAYLVVCDTVIDDLSDSTYPDRPWGPGNGPKTAVREFLKNNADFEIDRELDKRLLFTFTPNGYLRRVESEG